MPVKAAMLKEAGAAMPAPLWAEDGEFAAHVAAVKQALGPERVKLLASASKGEEIVKLLGSVAGGLKVEKRVVARDKETALQFKEQGNDYYRQHNYHEAFKLYTKALQHYPVDEANPLDPKNKDYSIIWANRSAALDGAGLYAAAIHDIDMALKFGYPRELWYKIYRRKGHAAIKMRQYLAAREALEISLKNVGRSDIKKEKDRDNYRTKVRKQMTVFNVTKTLYNTELYEHMPSTLAGGEKEDRGLSKRLSIVEDGGKEALVVEEPLEPQDVVVALDPHVAVVNVSGGRAGGKICPHTIDRMFHPVPCSLGSEEVFSSAEVRDLANCTYHQYEWSILANISQVKLLERARLALRMVTVIKPEDLSIVASYLGKSASACPREDLRTSIEAYNLPVEAPTEEEKVAAAIVALYLTRNLQLSGYVRVPSKAGSNLNTEEMEVFNMLRSAILIALRHTRPIVLMEVPKEKKEILATEITKDTCGYAIYPGLHKLEKAGGGPESHVITWNVTKKLVMSTFRKLEKGAKLCIVQTDNKTEKQVANDMITFRCANELCTNGFPLKENTKEKIISCPIADCGLKTNIWDRLRLIQRLKKDFASAKEQFQKGEVALAKDILKETIDEWDRIIIRPYKEVDQLQELFIKTLLCEIGDRERLLVEGNEMGYIQPSKSRVMAPSTEEKQEDGGNRIKEITNETKENNAVTVK